MAKVFNVRFPMGKLALYECILAQLFSKFKEDIESGGIYTDNEKRGIVSKFQNVFDSASRRFGNKERLDDALEDLMMLSQASGLEGSFQDLLKELRYNEVRIKWDEDNIFIDEIRGTEEIRATLKIFGINKT